MSEIREKLLELSRAGLEAQKALAEIDRQDRIQKGRQQVALSIGATPAFREFHQSKIDALKNFASPINIKTFVSEFDALANENEELIDRIDTLNRELEDRG